MPRDPSHLLSFFPDAMYFSYTELAALLHVFLLDNSFLTLLFFHFSTWNAPFIPSWLMSSLVCSWQLSMISHGEFGGLLAMAHWPQGWLLHWNIIVALMVQWVPEGRNGYWSSFCYLVTWYQMVPWWPWYFNKFVEGKNVFSWLGIEHNPPNVSW